MQTTVTPRADGRFHVELDWRPNETGVFTREELHATAVAMLRAAHAPDAIYCPECGYKVIT